MSTNYALSQQNIVALKLAALSLIKKEIEVNDTSLLSRSSAGNVIANDLKRTSIAAIQTPQLVDIKCVVLGEVVCPIVKLVNESCNRRMLLLKADRVSSAIGLTGRPISASRAVKNYYLELTYIDIVNEKETSSELDGEELNESLRMLLSDKVWPNDIKDDDVMQTTVLECLTLEECNSMVEAMQCYISKSAEFLLNFINKNFRLPPPTLEFHRCEPNVIPLGTATKVVLYGNKFCYQPDVDYMIRINRWDISHIIKEVTILSDSELSFHTPLFNTAGLYVIACSMDGGDTWLDESHVNVTVLNTKDILVAINCGGPSYVSSKVCHFSSFISILEYIF